MDLGIIQEGEPAIRVALRDNLDGDAAGAELRHHRRQLLAASVIWHSRPTV
jgi:hypothetical protein